MESIINNLSDIFLAMGYTGIFIMMTLESSFFPFPSEIAMIPAGVLIAEHELNLALVLLAGTVGSILGASVNYYIGRRFGRVFILNYGKYLFVDEKKLLKVEQLFLNRGRTFVFLGRLLPIVRQYISFLPGISGMAFAPFAIYTGLGSLIWVIFLTSIGYFYGDNYRAIDHAMARFKYVIIALVVLFIIYRVIKLVKKKNSNK